jgi:ketosteroid isomerase-like protein
MSVTEVKESYVAAVRRGDFDAAFGRFAEDIVFRIPGRSEFAGEHRGHAAAMAYIEAARARSREHQVQVEIVDALVSAERFALVIEIPRANVYRVRGEEIVEIWIFEGDQYAVDALMAPG